MESNTTKKEDSREHAPRDGVAFRASQSVAVTASKTVVTGNELLPRNKNGRCQSADRAHPVERRCLTMTVRLMGLFVMVSLLICTMSNKSMVQLPPFNCNVTVGSLLIKAASIRKHSWGLKSAQLTVSWMVPM